MIHPADEQAINDIEIDKNGNLIIGDGSGQIIRLVQSKIVEDLAEGVEGIGRLTKARSAECST